MSEKLKPIIGGLNQLANKIRAYHGSPHKFDRFDMSRIGTGEGAQSFGHGLYFAENPEVASRYKRKFEADVERSPLTMQISLPQGATERQARFIENALKSYDGNTDHAIKALRHSLNYHENPTEDWISDIQYSIDALKNKQARVSWDSPRNKAYMYEVDLNVPRERFISADEGWPYQPKEAMEVFDHYLKDEPWRQSEWALKGRRQPSGLDEYFSLAARLSNKPTGSWASPEATAKASNILNEAGVPGIRYLDQGSRGAGTGTHNIVMFDDAPIEIVNRYAEGGAVEGDGIPVPPEIAQQILGQGFADGGAVEQDWGTYAERPQATTNPATSPVQQPPISQLAPTAQPAAPSPEEYIQQRMSMLTPDSDPSGSRDPGRDIANQNPAQIGSGYNTPGQVLGGAGAVLGIPGLGAAGSMYGASQANDLLGQLGLPQDVSLAQAAISGLSGGMFGQSPQAAFEQSIGRDLSNYDANLMERMAQMQRAREQQIAAAQNPATSYAGMVSQGAMTPGAAATAASQSLDTVGMLGDVLASIDRAAQGQDQGGGSQDTGPSPGDPTGGEGPAGLARGGMFRRP